MNKEIRNKLIEKLNALDKYLVVWLARREGLLSDDPESWPRREKTTSLDLPDHHSKKSLSETDPRRLYYVIRSNPGSLQNP